jgi:hypothetical protein
VRYICKYKRIKRDKIKKNFDKFFIRVVLDIDINIFTDNKNKSIIAENASYGYFTKLKKNINK